MQILIRVALKLSLNTLFTIDGIVWDMESEGLFEHLCCLQVTKEVLHMYTMIGQPSIATKKKHDFVESNFQLHHAVGRMRKRGSTCMIKSFKQVETGLGFLIRVEQRMNSTIYQSIVAVHVYPINLIAYPKGDGNFRQDEAWRHCDCIVQDWF